MPLVIAPKDSVVCGMYHHRLDRRGADVQSNQKLLHSFFSDELGGLPRRQENSLAAPEGKVLIHQVTDMEGKLRRRSSNARPVRNLVKRFPQLRMFGYIFSKIIERFTRLHQHAFEFGSRLV